MLEVLTEGDLLKLLSNDGGGVEKRSEVTRSGSRRNVDCGYEQVGKEQGQQAISKGELGR